MKRHRNIDKVLEVWFLEGSSQMPDRLFDAVFDQVERVPQRRSARLQLRLTSMSSPIRWMALAAAAVVVVAGAGAFMLTRPSGVGVGPSPTPIASPSPSASATPLPEALRHTWVGATRNVPDLTPTSDRSGLKISAFDLQYYGGGPSPAFSSQASFADPDTLIFKLETAQAGCKGGDLGSYRFSLSPSGRALALQVVTEACAARAAAISGDWDKVGCPGSQWCLGDLDAGTHKSSAFNPFTPLTAYRYDYGRLEYTVPDGWSNSVDGASGFFLVKQGAPDDGGILVFQTALADSQAEGCPGTVEPNVGATASALSTWLSTLLGLNTTSPVAVTIGGLSGFTLDVSVDPAWTRTCGFSNGEPYVPLFTNGLYTEDTNFDWGIGGDGRMRLFLLDLPDGRTMLIDVEAHDKATWDALVDDASAIVETFKFNP